jgi:fatty-acid desaturase
MATISTDRMWDDDSSAIAGKVVWTPARSIWTAGMTAVALAFGPPLFSWPALALFVVATAITICAGHSIGMHRLLIHRSFKAPLWLEYCLVYLGTLVGMAGPFGMIRAHDIRDWAQRQKQCHDLHAHRRPFLYDAWWQMHCQVALDRPPRFMLESHIAEDRLYRFLERTWMAQQLPWALLFYAGGGWAFVVWGVAVRVAASLTGHWLIGHFAHRSGSQIWRVDGVAVQGFNIAYCGIVTFGESYHGNHHAYPGSARLGMESGEIDPGWYLLATLRRLGLVWGLKEPKDLVEREGLRRIG